MKFGMYR